MKSLLAASAALALIAVAAPAAAETYVNLGYTGVEPDDSSLGAVTGRVGWRQGYFGVEAEASKGVRDDSTTVAGVNTDVELDYQYAGYVTGTVPVSPNFELIGRVGYGQTKITASTTAAGGVSLSEKVDSINYGVGAQYNWGANGIRGDYTRHDFRGDDNGEADAWTVSYVRRF